MKYFVLIFCSLNALSQSKVFSVCEASPNEPAYKKDLIVVRYHETRRWNLKYRYDTITRNGKLYYYEKAAFFKDTLILLTTEIQETFYIYTEIDKTEFSYNPLKDNVRYFYNEKFHAKISFYKGQIITPVCTYDNLIEFEIHPYSEPGPKDYYTLKTYYKLGVGVVAKFKDSKLIEYMKKKYLE